jgi:uncharacterized protein YdiU (UPF0061 family)
MNVTNPKYVLRKHISQLVIDKANQGDYGLPVEVYKMLQTPTTSSQSLNNGSSCYRNERALKQVIVCGVVVVKSASNLVATFIGVTTVYYQ